MNGSQLRKHAGHKLAANHHLVRPATSISSSMHNGKATAAVAIGKPYPKLHDFAITKKKASIRCKSMVLSLIWENSGSCHKN